MELINNRYKIEKKISDDITGTLYKAQDLWNNYKSILLKIFKKENHSDNFIEFLSDKFIWFSSFKHDYLQEVYNFSIVNTIDNKKNDKMLYLYTMEYIEGESLGEYWSKLSIGEFLDIMRQLCHVVDYLKAKGLAYKYINPTNIFINKVEGQVNIKLKNLATINDMELRSFHHNYISYFIAPEVNINEKNINREADLYSIGMILNHFLEDSKLSNIRDELSDKEKQILTKIMKKLIKEEPSSRDVNILDVIKEINEISETNYTIELAKEREKLNFNNVIVGRDRELNAILQINNEFEDRIYIKRMVNILGDSGIGKTRLLQEINFKLKLKGKNVYRASIVDKDNRRLGPIVNIIKKIIKFCNRKLIKKYGSELVKVVPEINSIVNVVPSSNLNEDSEKFRLYDRIANFFIDFIDNKPTYIIIDDVHNCDLETLEFIDYILKIEKAFPLLIITASSSGFLNELDNNQRTEFINKWKLNTNIKNINLFRLDFSEISLMIKNILGINYKPVEFSTKIMNETAGNPRHIEEVIKTLYAEGELFINENGNWALNGQGYSNIYMPSSIDDAIKNQIDLLDKDLYKIAKIISIFKTSVSKLIITFVYEAIDENSIEGMDKLINELVDMKIIDERVEDWGYTYDFYNTKIKRYVYHTIADFEKENLHKIASRVLEEVYSKEGRKNTDELIYHLDMSKQHKKAITYSIISARKMEKLVGTNQALLLWQKAYSLLKHHKSNRKLYVMFNLARLYSEQGDNNKAIRVCNSIIDEAESIEFKRTKEYRYIVDSSNKLGDIYIKRNNIRKSEKILNRAKTLGEKIGYIKGILESVKLLNSVYIIKREYHLAIKNRKYIDLAKKYEHNQYIGHMYNQIGVINMFKGDISEARKNYELSIKYFYKAKTFIDATKPINNIGVIHSDYYNEKEEAMEYFQKGLNICKKHNELKGQITFLVNIGEMYHGEDKINRAEEYYERALKIAKESEERSAVFLLEIDLGRLYLERGYYDKSYEYYNIVKKEFHKNPIQGENIPKYYRFLTEFYYNFGQLDKALENAIKTKETCNKIDLEVYLEVESRILVIEYIKEGFLNKRLINKIIESLLDNKLFTLARKSILEFAYFSAIDGDEEYCKRLLKIDSNLMGKCSTDYIRIKRKIIVSLISMDLDNDIKTLLLLEEDIAKYEFPKLELYLNIILGNKFFDKTKYYKSTNYYINAIDLYHRMLKRIPKDWLREKYIIKNIMYTIVDKIEKIKEVVLGIKSRKKLTKIELDDYLNFNNLKELINNKKVYSVAMKHYNNFIIGNINNVGDLITNFTTDYIKNMDMVLRYALRETFAKRGFIALYEENGDDLKIIASTTESYQIPIGREIVSKVKHDRKGIILNSAFDFQDNKYLMVDDEIKALICVPIYKFKEDFNIKFNKEYNTGGFNNREIIGYLYLDTDKLFNRFDKERYNIMESLACLSSINIDNHHLKITSSIDKMTGVYTRKYFDTIMEQVIEKANYESFDFSIVMVDIDKFKVVNDTFGHRKGDKILSQVGKIIKDNVKSGDIVGRYGGEEFIIILLNSDEKEAKYIGEKIRKEVKGSQLIDENHPLTISLGISVFRKHSNDKEDLIEKADQALYHSKETGRDRTVIWSKDIGKTNKRLDKLAGIVSGNAVQDQRNVLAIVEIINLLKQDMAKKDKIYRFLGRLIEIIEGDKGLLFTLDADNKINNIYGRQRFSDDWSLDEKYNEDLIKEVIEKRTGRYLINWKDIGDVDVITGVPDWQSLIITPIIYSGQIKGILQISVPIKEKEFDYNDYNFINTVSDIIAAII